MLPINGSHIFVAGGGSFGEGEARSDVYILNLDADNNLDRSVGEKWALLATKVLLSPSF